MSLEVRDLVVRFWGVSALAGVSFAVRPGGVTSLIGPNGAGKTTAFNVITGFQTPASGRVAWEGRDVTGGRPCRIAALGLVRTFQKTSVFPTLPVLENVLTGLHLRGRTGLAAALLRRRRVAAEERALRELTSYQWQMLLYGVLLIAVLFLMPEGIVPALRRRWRPS